MPILFYKSVNLIDLRQAPYSMLRQDYKAINKILNPLIVVSVIEKVPLGKPLLATSSTFLV
jgi:hypothetical protein